MKPFQSLLAAAFAAAAMQPRRTPPPHRRPDQRRRRRHDRRLRRRAGVRACRRLGFLRFHVPRRRTDRRRDLSAAGVSAQPQRASSRRTTPGPRWPAVPAPSSARAGHDLCRLPLGFGRHHNTVTFYDGASVIASFVGGPGGLGVNQVPVGDGNQATAQYMNFWAPSITRVTFASSQNALEIDNVSAVPEARDAPADAGRPGGGRIRRARRIAPR